MHLMKTNIMGLDCSCTTQQPALTEDLSFALDNQKQIDVILDFSKAFDSVPHPR